jgi:hypothetical protein
MTVARFPLRGIEAVLIVPERDGEGTLVLMHSFGWVFGSRIAARREARLLARQHGFPVREVEG